jgi:hypothetical protein
MAGGEPALTFPRRLLDEIGALQGLRADLGAYVPRILEAQYTKYVPRSLAEDDPSFNQIIPYVLVRGDHAPSRRAGQGLGREAPRGEGLDRDWRPHQPRDEDLFGVGLDLDFYEEAVQRELHEELLIDADFTWRVVALIDDDSTPVGQVHFGVVPALPGPCAVELRSGRPVGTAVCRNSGELTRAGMLGHCEKHVDTAAATMVSCLRSV